MTQEILKSQMIRQAVLNLLALFDAARGRYALTKEQIRRNFIKGRTEVTAADLESELTDLAEQRLIAATFDEELGVWLYTIATRGRDFRRAGFPWDKLDEFSGADAPAH